MAEKRQPAQIFAKTLRAHAELFRAWEKFELGDQPVPAPFDYKSIAELLDRVAEELDQSGFVKTGRPSGPISEEGFEE